MIATMRAELVTYLRRRVLWRAALSCTVIAIASTAIVLASAPDRPSFGNPGGATRASLALAGGGTEVFTTTMRFTGVFAFVVFIGVIASEFSRGTMRTMLLREPRRVRLLAGKVVAMIGFAAVLLAVTEVLTWFAALALAGANDLDNGAWLSAAALGNGLEDYVKVLVWLTGYAVFGATVAVLLRSVPVGLAVGIFWSGPFEHLLEDAWAPARRWFPGLLLEAFVAGGNGEVSATRALVTASSYAVVGAAIAAWVFTRRDVTS